MMTAVTVSGCSAVLTVACDGGCEAREAPVTTWAGDAASQWGS